MPQPCIVFDLDDTLYLERDFVRSGFDAVGRWAVSTLGLSGCSERAWRAFEAGTRGSIFQTVLADLDRTPDAVTVEQMVRVYRTHCPTISMPADALHCLRELKPHAILGVITDGFSETQYAKCRSLSLPDLVDIIVCTGQWGPEYYKPNPRAFQYVQEQVGPSASRFVYVADNPAKDFQAPIDLGWDVVRIRRPAGLYASRVWHTEPPPYVEVQDLWHLPEILLKRGQPETGIASSTNF